MTGGFRERRAGAEQVGETSVCAARSVMALRSCRTHNGASGPCGSRVARTASVSDGLVTGSPNPGTMRDSPPSLNWPFSISAAA